MRERLCAFLGVLVLCVLALTCLSAGVRAESVPGDANRDGAINQTDLMTVLDHYNQGVSGDAWSFGDFDSNGNVNGADFNMLLSNYTGGGSSSGVVPEPATLLLLVAGLLGLLAYGWRKRR